MFLVPWKVNEWDLNFTISIGGHRRRRFGWGQKYQRVRQQEYLCEVVIILACDSFLRILGTKIFFVRDTSLAFISRFFNYWFSTQTLYARIVKLIHAITMMQFSLNSKQNWLRYVENNIWKIMMFNDKVQIFRTQAQSKNRQKFQWLIIQRIFIQFDWFLKICNQNM